ncbi:MAG TPA: DMT family transporter, partial [Ilumatobacter sp.]|nr:DMT family transporter [Ilumatobacter sp.]
MKTWVPQSHAAVAAVTLIAPIAWGTTYVTVTEFLPPDRPLLVAAMRVLPAGVILAALGHLTGGRRPHGRQWLHIAALALLNFAVFFPLLVVAIYRLPGGVAASAGGVQPLLVAALSAALGVSVPRRRDLVVGIIAAIGVALVVVRPGASVDPVGVLAAMGANVSFALGVVLTKRFPAPANRVGSTGWQLLVS